MIQDFLPGMSDEDLGIVTHMIGWAFVTFCCERYERDLPAGYRLTANPELITCGGV
jgi:hypothetical protein